MSFFNGLPLWMIGASLLLSVALAIHVVRSGRELFWVWIILLFQPIGGLVYFLAILLPDALRGAGARKLQEKAIDTLDPTREYRDAKAACDDTPTVRNQARLAAAAATLGRWEEAEGLYRAAAHGIHEDDPALRLGQAKALLELGRPGEAIEVIQRMDQDTLSPSASLALARALEGVGRTSEADEMYRWASERVAGFEGLARYAAFQARQGRRDEARDIVGELDKRLEKLRGQFAKEGKQWRDHAAKALAES